MHLRFSLLLCVSLFPTVVSIGREPWKVSEEVMKRFRGDHKILEDIELVGSSLVLCWMRKWMFMLASSNDSMCFLSWPEGIELLPTQGEHRDKRRFTGRHLRQKKKNQRAGWGWSPFQKILEKWLIMFYNDLMYPKLLKIPTLIILYKTGKTLAHGKQQY